MQLEDATLTTGIAVGRALATLGYKDLPPSLMAQKATRSRIINMLSFLLVVAVAVSQVTADQIPEFVVPGKCPIVNEQKLWDDLFPNMSRFGGTWYQQAISTNPYQRLKECAEIKFDYNGNGFDGSSSGIDATGKPAKMKGVINFKPFGEPHLMIHFKGTMPSPLVVLDTDYTNYACLYSCVDYNYDYHSDFAFYFSRNPTPSSSYKLKCENVFKKHGFDVNRLTKTRQGSGCDYESLRRARDEL